LKTTPALSNGDVLAATDVTATEKAAGSLTKLTNSLADVKGGTISADQYRAIATNLGNVNIVGSKQYLDAQGTAYHYVFTLNDPDLLYQTNYRSVFGNTLKASVTAQLTKTTANNTTSDSSWIS